MDVRRLIMMMEGRDASDACPIRCDRSGAKKCLGRVVFVLFVGYDMLNQSLTKANSYNALIFLTFFFFIADFFFFLFAFFLGPYSERNFF
jgi:hypothetical protein